MQLRHWATTNHQCSGRGRETTTRGTKQRSKKRPTHCILQQSQFTPLPSLWFMPSVAIACCHFNAKGVINIKYEFSLLFLLYLCLCSITLRVLSTVLKVRESTIFQLQRSLCQHYWVWPLLILHFSNFFQTIIFFNSNFLV